MSRAAYLNRLLDEALGQQQQKTPSANPGARLTASQALEGLIAKLEPAPAAAPKLEPKPGG